MEQATTDTTILIIEDHDAARLLMTNMFKKDYNNVVAKKDGIEALAWLAAGNIPDLIISDMAMPRLGGLMFLKQVKNSGIYRDIPIVIVSSNENEEEIQEYFALGIWAFLLKPFNPLELKQKVKSILEKNMKTA